MSGQLVESFKVASTLTAYRVVAAVSGTANTVQYPEATTKLPLGITIDDVKDTNQAIPVAVSGIAKLQFNDTVTSGQLVGFDVNGLGVPVTITSGAGYTTTMAVVGIIGTLIGPTVAATGTIAQVLIQPQIMR